MFITNEKLETLKLAYNALERELHYSTEQKDKELLNDFKSLLIEYDAEREKRNKKTAKYIAEKRKLDKNYAR